MVAVVVVRSSNRPFAPSMWSVSMCSRSACAFRGGRTTFSGAGSLRLRLTNDRSISGARTCTRCTSNRFSLISAQMSTPVRSTIAARAAYQAVESSAAGSASGRISRSRNSMLPETSETCTDPNPTL